MSGLWKGLHDPVYLECLGRGGAGRMKKKIEELIVENYEPTVPRSLLKLKINKYKGTKVLCNQIAQNQH